MYIPNQFKESSLDVLHAAIRERKFAEIIVSVDGNVMISHNPLLLKQDSGSDNGVLHGHFSKSNPLSHLLACNTKVLIVFNIADAYISPSWYASKKEDGRVVPTWNYSAIYVHGRLNYISDSLWLIKHLRDLTKENEKNFIHPWEMEDAPEDFIMKLSEMIVGFEIDITDVVGKCKANQNHPLQNRESVEEGLRSIGSNRMADMVKSGSII